MLRSHVSSLEIQGEVAAVGEVGPARAYQCYQGRLTWGEVSPNFLNKCNCIVDVMQAHTVMKFSKNFEYMQISSNKSSKTSTIKGAL